MATANWSNTGYHNSDANFRIWGSALSTQLQAMAGLVKTGDTGQINWVTVTRAGASADAGYEIYYLNDAMHATAPVYIKIYFGTGVSTGCGRLKFEVGTGSNGSGTLTGVGVGTFIYANYSYNASTSTPTYTSYLCVTEGHFLLIPWKGAGFQGTICIDRTCDETGTPDAYGVCFKAYGNSTSNSVNARYSGGSYRFDGTDAIINTPLLGGYYTNIYKPLGLTAAESVLPSGDYQAYMAWEAFPDMRPIIGQCAVFLSQLPDLTTFSTTLVGSTAHTYLVQGSILSLGDVWGDCYPAFLWE